MSKKLKPTKAKRKVVPAKSRKSPPKKENRVKPKPDTLFVSVAPSNFTAPTELEYYCNLFAFSLPKDWNKPTKKGGQPRAVNEREVRLLEMAFAMDCTVLEACLYAGISKSTFYAFVETLPEFSDTIEIMRNIPVLIARKFIVTGLDRASAMDYIERKRKSEFSKKTETEGLNKTLNVNVDPATQSKIDDVFDMFQRKARESADDMSPPADDLGEEDEA